MTVNTETEHMYNKEVTLYKQGRLSSHEPTHVNIVLASHNIYGARTLVY